MYNKAASLVAEKGYTNIRVYKAGIPGWVMAGNHLNKEHALPGSNIPILNAAQLKQQLDDVIILDIRTPSLYEMGWIKDSVKIPLGRLSKKYVEIPTGKPIVVVDHAGKQVLSAGRFLVSKGYPDVKRLQSGVISCIRQGFPIEK